MSNEVNRFTFFRGYAESMEMLSDPEAGRLIKAMSKYAFEGVEPKFTNRNLKLLWPTIKPNIETNVKKIKGAEQKKP